MYQLLADIVLVSHFSFIVFVLAGGLLLLRWPRLVWMHLPAVVWVVLAEMSGWVCPLTPLENYFQRLGGGNIYRGDFIERYLLPLVYPAGLTQTIQLVLAGVVIAFNLIIYAVIIRARLRTRRVSQHTVR